MYPRAFLKADDFSALYTLSFSNENVCLFVRLFVSHFMNHICTLNIQCQPIVVVVVNEPAVRWKEFLRKVIPQVDNY